MKYLAARIAVWLGIVLAIPHLKIWQAIMLALAVVVLSELDRMERKQEEDNE